LRFSVSVGLIRLGHNESLELRPGHKARFPHLIERKPLPVIFPNRVGTYVHCLFRLGEPKQVKTLGHWLRWCDIIARTVFHIRLLTVTILQNYKGVTEHIEQFEHVKL
jgi:hypothetical protein